MLIVWIHVLMEILNKFIDINHLCHFVQFMNSQNFKTLRNKDSWTVIRWWSWMLYNNLIIREEEDRKEELRKEQEERDKMIAVSISEDNKATVVKEDDQIKWVIWITSANKRWISLYIQREFDFDIE